MHKRYPLLEYDPHRPRCMRYFEYAESYRDAIKNHIKSINRTGTYKDLEVLPVLFLLRHYIELTLKALMLYEHKDSRDAPIKGHDLNILLANIRAFPVSEDIRKFIRLLNADKSADVFRYPENNKLEPYDLKYRAQNKEIFDMLTDLGELIPLTETITDELHYVGCFIETQMDEYFSTEGEHGFSVNYMDIHEIKHSFSEAY